MPHSPKASDFADALLPGTPGWASLEVEQIDGASAVTSLYATSPMKVLCPRSRGPSVWAYLSSYGGGLVAGDNTRLRVRLGREARCFLGTQSSTKVYRNPDGRPSGHDTLAVLGPGSFLMLAPDPIQAFGDSLYRQRQEFHLASDASLALLDWVSSGRSARGERWAFSLFSSRNDLFVGGRRVLLDSVRLSPGEGPLQDPHRMGGFECIASLLLTGPVLAPLSAALLEQTAAHPVLPGEPLVCSASPIHGGALLRIAGASVEQVGGLLHRHLARLADPLGDDPWSRKS